jgi:hypothetical protein
MNGTEWRNSASKVWDSLCHSCPGYDSSKVIKAEALAGKVTGMGRDGAGAVSSLTALWSLTHCYRTCQGNNVTRAPWHGMSPWWAGLPALEPRTRKPPISSYEGL